MQAVLPVEAYTTCSGPHGQMATEETAVSLDESPSSSPVTSDGTPVVVVGMGLHGVGAMEERSMRDASCWVSMLWVHRNPSC